jgi:hypothetical protein
VQNGFRTGSEKRRQSKVGAFVIESKAVRRKETGEYHDNVYEAFPAHHNLWRNGAMRLRESISHGAGLMNRLPEQFSFGRTAELDQLSGLSPGQGRI